MGFSNSLVSIVVPIYNAERYLDECLESIVNQDYKNIEIILINDGSKDSSLNLMQSWEEKDSRIILIDQENRGVSYTRNKAISIASGEYITFIDADDIISSDFISVLLQSMLSTKADCSVCNIQPFSMGSPIHFSKGSNTTYNSQETIELLFGHLHGFMANKMYKCSIIKQYGIMLNPEIAISEDLLFNYEYIHRTHTTVYYSGVKYLYRQHGESAFNRLSNIRWFSVLDTMQLLLDKINAYDNIWSSIAVNYMMLTYEAKYRVKFCNSVTPQILSKIETGSHFAEANIGKLDCKNRIKISIMKYLPSLVMFYRRRKKNI